MNTTKKVMITAFGFILMASLVAAAGVSVPYWSGNSLKMYPGENATIYLILQNEQSEQMSFDLTVVQDGNGIATVDSLSYVVPPKTYDVRVPIHIDVPEDFQYGGTHEINIEFSPIITASEGTVRFRPAFSAHFPIDVVDVTESTFYEAPPEKEGLSPVWYIVIILALVIIVMLFFLLKKKQEGTTTTKKPTAKKKKK